MIYSPAPYPPVIRSSMCSCRRTRAPHLLLEPSTGRFSVRLYRFSQRAGETMRIATILHSAKRSKYSKIAKHSKYSITAKRSKYSKIAKQSKYSKIATRYKYSKTAKQSKYSITAKRSKKKRKPDCLSGLCGNFSIVL